MMKPVVLVIALLVGVLTHICKASVIKNRQVDLTIASGSSGEDVVTACIKEIADLQVFPEDFGLIKRIAKYESDFGLNYATADQSRGIWHISPAVQLELENPTNELTLRSQIEDISFGSDVDFDNLDYTFPIYAAISARLYMQLVQGSEALPQTLEDQAEWWSLNYNTDGSTTDFIETIRAYEFSIDSDEKESADLLEVDTVTDSSATTETLSTGAIVGIVIGSIAVLCCLCCGGYTVTTKTKTRVSYF